MTDRVNWKEVVDDILNTPTEDYTYQSLGAAIGASRAFIGRLVKNGVEADPPFSKGHALLQLRKQIREKQGNTHNNSRRRG